MSHFFAATFSSGDALFTVMLLFRRVRHFSRSGTYPAAGVVVCMVYGGVICPSGEALFAATFAGAFLMDVVGFPQEVILGCVDVCPSIFQ